VSNYSRSIVLFIIVFKITLIHMGFGIDTGTAAYH
jgi:hypothetical protein